jgi:hypothetical protein
VTYKLSKWLVKLLSPFVGTFSESHILNSLDFINKIKFPSYPFKLVSFDVTSLFTNVPVDEVLDFLRMKLVNASLPVSLDVLLELIKLCVIDCIFQFNGQFYSMISGLAMGNPLSPVLANIFYGIF